MPINISLKSVVGNAELTHLNFSKNILDKYIR